MLHVRPRRAALAALAASSLLLLSACDGDTAPAGAGTKARSTPSAPPEAITADQAQQALVTVEDLPSGWQLQPDTGLDKSQGAQEEIISGVKPVCAPITAVLNTGRLEEDRKADAQEVFAKKGDTTAVVQDVSGYSRAQAEKAVAALRTAVEQCGTFTGTMGGKKAVLTVKKAAGLPAYGDESLGYTVRIVQGGTTQMDFDLDTIRSHGAVTTLWNNYSDTGDRGTTAFRKALARAGAKLVAAAAGTP
ncbi:hypothetical protein [Streptomyces sp. NPDC049555]|uniref:hypothetical protein n=1 Tax=Streptomyces sp. NPDC049555 TaxID=3154930 RepID=UPI00341C3CC3